MRGSTWDRTILAEDFPKPTSRPDVNRNRHHYPLGLDYPMSGSVCRCVWRSVGLSLHSSPLRMTKATHRATNIMQKRTHSFAPISNGSNAAGGHLRLKGIVFDMDGTLCKQIEDLCPFKQLCSLRFRKKACHRTTCSP